VKTAAVLDTACLIGLERLGRLELIPRLLSAAVVPPAVAEEFGPLPDGVTLGNLTDLRLAETLRLVLDPGEAEVIALASQLGFRAILDDRKARLLAAQLNIPVTGTVGLLLKAKQEGHIPALRPLLDNLSHAGFHLALALRAEALRLAGE